MKKCNLNYCLKNRIYFLFYVLVFVLASNVVKGQTYDTVIGYFGDEITWDIDCRGRLVNLVAHQDTLLGTQHYRKLAIASFEPKHYSDKVNDKAAFIREDGATGKVWIRDYIKVGKELVEKEVLVMDMSLEEGDSIQIPISNLNQLEWVYVDRVYEEFGKKIIEFDYIVRTVEYQKSGRPQILKEPDYLQFIEGVGPNIGWAFKYDRQNSYHFVKAKADNYQSVWPMQSLEQFNKQPNNRRQVKQHLLSEEQQIGW